jgi:methionyl-tRNA synthetase
MVSGSDEHGTPITVTAELEGVSPDIIIDRYHSINRDALKNLGCSWEPHIDSRGVDFGGALFNRTSDPEHAEIVQQNFLNLLKAGLFEQKTMEQYYEIRKDGGRFLPDRYVEGICPNCEANEARGDQCDSCGTTYEARELKNPISKMNPDAQIEIKETEHFFYRLDRFQESLEEHAAKRQSIWKPNVRAMTKQWLSMGLRPRAVTRDLSWGIPLPLPGKEWQGKCIYVWFEAVQGYYSCSKIWAKRYANPNGHARGEDAWMSWWKEGEDGSQPRHLYYLGKDNIPFHTVIWPALILGLNHASNGRGENDEIMPVGPDDLHLEDDVPANEYLMLAGGQFSKSRKHAVWLPSFLERFDPDTLRYYLGINMPEAHDTDFNWPDFVEKINNELNGTYGNYVNRVMTLGTKLSGEKPLEERENLTCCSDAMVQLEQIHTQIGTSLDKHRYKEALRGVMSAAQLGNQLLQSAAPWKYLKAKHSDEAKTSFAQLSFGWRICRFLAITSQPFLPFSAQRLWSMLGQEGYVSDITWHSAIDWEAPQTWAAEKIVPLFHRLDLEEILEQEKVLAESASATNEAQDPGHGVKGVVGKKKGTGDKDMSQKKRVVSEEGEVVKDKNNEGIQTVDFETFISVDLKIGTITTVTKHPNADKLFVIKISDGSENGRTVCAGLVGHYSIDELLNQRVVFVANLSPRKLRGVMSEGMILAADDGQGTVKLISVSDGILDGSQVK